MLHSADGDTLHETIDAILCHAVESGQAPGLVAMATDGRQTLYEGAFGVRSLNAPEPMTLDTVFWIASMTKAITSVACLQLVEQGRIGLHEPLGAIVPKLGNPQVMDGFNPGGKPLLRPATREVTLHDLLTHTSGYVYETWNPEMAAYLRATGLPRMGTGLVAALDMPLAFDPGTRWEYGIGIDWVGKVIEAVTGQSLGTYLHEHVFTPLGMTDTGFAPSEDRQAGMHSRTEAGGLRSGSTGRTGRPELEGGGGGLFSTGPDYLRFLAALLQGGGPLLKPETLALMTRNQLGGALDVTRVETVLPALSNPVELFQGMTKHWGYGFLINTAAGHAGRSAGSLTWAGLPNCYYWIDPARNIAALLMMQILPFADAAALDVLDRFEAALYAAHSKEAV